MKRVLPVFKGTEEIPNIRVIDRLARIIRDQVLLGHIGHVIALIVFGQKVIEGLFLHRTAVFRDRVIPFLGICELWVYVEHHTPKRVFAVSDDLPKMIFCTRRIHNSQPLPAHFTAYKWALSIFR